MESQPIPENQQVFRKHCESIMVAIFFTIFVVGYGVFAGYIISFITALTGILAVGWIAAGIITIYLLHSGLFSSTFTGWMNIAKKIADGISTAYFQEESEVTVT